MKIGDVVIVRTDTIFDGHYKINATLKVGVVEYIADKWATVMLLSDKTRSAMYRQSFWKENIYEKKRRMNNE